MQWRGKDEDRPINRDDGSMGCFVGGREKIQVSGRMDGRMKKRTL
jgi:hypothetical protein